MANPSSKSDVRYQCSTEGVTPEMLTGFFEGWPNPPDSETHLRILKGSDHVVLAIDQAVCKVIGFITAISDCVSCAYIPHLEILSEYRGRGIGSELVRCLLDALSEIYAVDLMCDPDLEPFYERLGFRKGNGMIIRNYHNQSGLSPTSAEPQHIA